MKQSSLASKEEEEEEKLYNSELFITKKMRSFINKRTDIVFNII
jgi:hypothetical protein